MIWNRLICLGLILASGVFVSYYGGIISYGLFYMALLVPVFSYLYTLYVFVRFRTYQEMEQLIVVKGDWNPIRFIIANEEPITFCSLKINFLQDYSTIEHANAVGEFTLLPNEKEEINTRLKCKYRGEYYVGGESIEVSDYFYLFRIKYPIQAKLKVLVLPRVIEVEQLAIAPYETDSKRPIFAHGQKNELDADIRRYYRGDTIKQIHWKSSAKMNQLMTRKHLERPKSEVVLILDLCPIQMDDLKQLIAEDQAIEGTLAIINYYCKCNVTCMVRYDMNGFQERVIDSMGTFQEFYRESGTLVFESSVPCQQLLLAKKLGRENQSFYIVITAKLTKELYYQLNQMIVEGNPCCILYLCESITKEQEGIMDGCLAAGIDIYSVSSSDEIQTILTKGSVKNGYQ